MRKALLVRVFGILDLFLLAYVVYSNVIQEKAYLIFSERLDMLSAFGSTYFDAIYVFGVIAVASLFVFGLLMLFLKRLGVVLSFAQAPFRIFLLIPPTFFFIQKIEAVPFVVSVILIYALEFLKITVQVQWYRAMGDQGGRVAQD